MQILGFYSALFEFFQAASFSPTLREPVMHL